jgi:HEPN domain-containing protein
MPVDPVLLAETKAWLRKAAYDLRAASHSLTASPPLLDDVVFHCQQAAEKALKGFLMWNNIPFRKTHSLEEIGEQCLDLDSTLQDFRDSGALTEYAKFRIRESLRNHPWRRGRGSGKALMPWRWHGSSRPEGIGRCCRQGLLWFYAAQALLRAQH